MKIRVRNLCRVVIGLVLPIGLMGAPASSADDAREAIAAVNEQWEAAVGRSDGAGVAALYTAEGQLLPTHSAVVSGTQAIGDFWQAAFDSGVKGASLGSLELEVHGDTANEIGTYELRDEDGAVIDHGKFVVIWKQEGGSWKLHRDMWNTSTAAPASCPHCASCKEGGCAGCKGGGCGRHTDH